MNESLLFLIPLLPLCCALVNLIFGMRLPRLFAEVMAVTGMANETNRLANGYRVPIDAAFDA